MVTDSLNKPEVDLILTGAAEVLTCVPATGNPAGRRAGVSVAIGGERIVAVETPAELARLANTATARVLDVGGKIIAPGFVDGHTHLIFGGTRAQEYAARLTRSAETVKASGIPTGIQATVAMTRAATPAELQSTAALRLEQMFCHGTTTVESKSGYGLSVEKELELLRVSRNLHHAQPVDLINTFLGAHDFPRELSRQAYFDCIINEMLPRVAAEGLAEFCDVYCDDGYYSVGQTQAILEAGLALGLKAKIHLDAYADIGGALMAAGLPVVSADHLNYTSPAGMRALAKAGVTGVVMPALDFAVKHSRPFNARMLMAEGVTLALATDLCPACWTVSMQLVMQLACRLYALSPEEALMAATVGAARSAGLDDRGTIEPGKLADLQVWGLPSFEDVVYRLGNNAVETVIKRGVIYTFKGTAP